MIKTLQQSGPSSVFVADGAERDLSPKTRQRLRLDKLQDLNSRLYREGLEELQFEAMDVFRAHRDFKEGRGEGRDRQRQMEGIINMGGG